MTLKWFEPFRKEYIGRVVHISGPLTTGEPLTEPDYNIQVQAVKLRRRVAMYQWVEESVERIGSNPHPQDVMEHDERQYFYSLEWREKLIDSSHFYMRSGHQNPLSFPFGGMIQIAEHVKIGPYELNEEVKESFSNFILITSDTRPDIPGVKLHSGFYYHTEDIHEPKVGDLRIQFLLAGLESTSYSVVGKLNESGIIEPFHSKVSQKLLIVKPGEQSIEQIMSQEWFSLTVKSWMIRVLGTALLFMGLSKLLEILTKSKLELNYLKELQDKSHVFFNFQDTKDPTRTWQD